MRWTSYGQLMDVLEWIEGTMKGVQAHFSLAFPWTMTISLALHVLMVDW